MKYYLETKYSEKDEVKALGARFDRDKKKWYFEDPERKTAFKKWIPDDRYDAIQPIILKDAEAVEEDDGEYRNPFAGNISVAAVSYEKLGIGSNLLILDTETTGLMDDDEVVEHGIIDKCGNEVFHSLFRPERRMTPEAAEKTGITNEALAAAPLFKDAADVIIGILKGHTVVGHNIAFDVRLLMQTAARYGLNEGNFKAALSDTVDSIDVCKKYLNLTSYSLKNVCYALGISDTQKHRSSYDCLMVLQTLLALETRPFCTRSGAESKIKRDEQLSGRTAKASDERGARILRHIRDDRMTISQTAEALGLSERTVIRYAIGLIKLEKIGVADVLAKEREDLIVSVTEGLPMWTGRKKPIFEAAEEAGTPVTYDEIEIALCGKRMASLIADAEKRKAVQQYA